MDIVSKEKRSQMMSGIRAKNTKPEIKVRQFIFSKGFRYRIHKKIHGIKPDIVMKKWNICIFINGLAIYLVLYRILWPLPAHKIIVLMLLFFSKLFVIVIYL